MTVESQEEIADNLMDWFGPKMVKVLQERLLRRTTEWQYSLLLPLAHHFHVAFFQMDSPGLQRN